MKLVICRRFVVIDERRITAGKMVDVPLRKVAAAAVVANPFAGRYVDNLDPLIEGSVQLGEDLAAEAVKALGPYQAESYGKGGIVGINGEQEHANALLTTVFANPLRHAIGGATAWISSMTKVAAPGVPIDIPMNHKDEVYVRSHYDGMTVMVPECPMPDEILVVFCLANRGRINARVGGLTHQDVSDRAMAAHID